MNANTAMKIQEAIGQAISCGESTHETLECVKKAMEDAKAEQIAAQLADYAAFSD